MASNQRTDDEEFKYTLRPWLKKKINDGKFEGLEWLDENHGKFKIPWAKSDHPHGQELLKLCKAWYQHKRKYDENVPPTDTRIKGNFRSVLRKSEDIVELKEEHHMDQQSGTYKVYRFRSPAELKDIKTELGKRPCPKAGAASNPTPKKQLMKECDSDADLTDNSPSTFSHDLIDDLVNDSSLFPPSSTNTSLFHEHAEFNQLLLDEIPPLEECGFQQSYINLQPPASIGEHFLENASVSNSLPGPIVDTVTPLETPQVVFIKEQLQELLKKLEISSDHLSRFLLTLVYGHETVVQKKELDLSEGCRVLYGDAQSQYNAIKANEVDSDDFKLAPFEFPCYEGHNKDLESYLKFADQGIILKVDDEWSLYGRRLCQTKVFYSDGTDIVKMERGENTPLFSYIKYIGDLMQWCSNTRHGNVPSCDVSLKIGRRSTAVGLHREDAVTIILEPLLGCRIIQYFGTENNISSSNCFSNETDVDQIIRPFNLQCGISM